MVIWLCCSLHSVHDEEKPFELEMAWICDSSNREFRRVPSDVVKAAEQEAKEALEESDMYVTWETYSPCETRCFSLCLSAIDNSFSHTLRPIIKLFKYI
jgi:hypothetical protein